MEGTTRIVHAPSQHTCGGTTPSFARSFTHCNSSAKEPGTLLLRFEILVFGDEVRYSLICLARYFLQLGISLLNFPKIMIFHLFALSTASLIEVAELVI